jgi:hypothetical protein
MFESEIRIRIRLDPHKINADPNYILKNDQFDNLHFLPSCQVKIALILMCVDQVVCRFIVAALAHIPLDSLLPVLLTQLPLKEDMDEYEMVFKVSHPHTGKFLSTVIVEMCGKVIVKGTVSRDCS